jgi:hypothetical protein
MLATKILKAAADKSQAEELRLLIITELCKQDIAEAEAKKTGGAGEVQRMRAAIRYINKISDTQPRFRGATIDNGKQYLVDGFSAIELYKPFDTIQTLPEPLEIGPRIINETERTNSAGLNFDPADLAAAAKIGKATKATKYGGSIEYKLENGQVIDANRALEILKVIGTDDLKIRAISADTAGNRREQLHQLLIISSKGRAVLLPLRVKEA